MNPVEKQSYWSERYLKNQVGWDCGQITPPIKEYIDQLTDKSISILIPGCGSGHEAEYLWMLGFTNVHLLDFAPEALTLFSERVRDFPKDQLHCGDFFAHAGKYDLIVEQTLFCAINPNQRKEYVDKIVMLLNPTGKLIGVLFNREFEGGPPFGGSIAEYEPLFSALFSSVYIEPCYNSIKPREGSEVFIKMNNVQ